MPDKAKTPRPLLPSLGFAGLLLLCPAAARAQEPQAGQGAEEEQTRQIKLSDFTKKRPPAGNADGKPSGGDSASSGAPTYRRLKPPASTHRRPARANASGARPANNTAAAPKSAAVNTKPAKGARTEPVEVREVGVTLWRLRPATEADTGPGFNVLQGGKLITMTPERIRGAAAVALGDRVRLSIESPADGYLYVINRELYADGTTGAPMLIFPTTRIRGGDNRVSAGRLIDIPDGADAQPFYTLTPNRQAGGPQILGELITILITPRPLEGVKPGRDRVPLSREQVDKWEGDWGGEVLELLEMNGGAGRAWTMAEKQAGEATRSLTQADPTPQTIYRVAGKANGPVMITVQLPYAAPAAAKPETTGQP